jgi:hypothetical protein
MTDLQDKTPAEKDGKYTFKLFYAEREVNCQVEKEQNMLHVVIDENITAELQLQDDGTLKQVSGTKLPQSSIDFIKKQIMGHEV